MDVTDALYAPQVLAAAGRLERIASGLRARAARLATAAAETRWDGDGARAFRRRCADTVDGTLRAAGTLDDAVATLRHHAAVVADASEARAVEERETWRRLAGVIR